MISIVIPAFNAQRWIDETIRSATTQTWRDIEVIVVDDGSTDDTAGIAEATGDQRVRLIRQPNAGAAAARNRGLRESKGDFIQFLDADDMLAPDKLHLQMDALAIAPAGSIASCAWGRFTENAHQADFPNEPVWTVADPVEWLVVSLGGGGMMQPAAWLSPRALLDEAGPWDETLTLHDDGEFFARVLLKATRNVFVPKARVFYRNVEGSLSRRRSRSAIESALAVCRSRAAGLLAVRQDKASQRAVATQYAQFAYEHALLARDLADEALDEMEALDAGPNPVIGGALFTILGRVVGFRAALRLRQDLRKTMRIGNLF